MNRIIFALALLLLAIAPALAQQTAPVTGLDQRVSEQLGQLMLRNIALGIQLENLQQQLAAAQARVKELEAKSN